METQGPRQSEGRARHAPRAWTYERQELADGIDHVVYDQMGRSIAMHLTEDHARLIAAVPEMLKALRNLCAEVGGLRAFEGSVRAEIGNTNWSLLMQRLEQADAVIAKATGA